MTPRTEEMDPRWHEITIRHLPTTRRMGRGGPATYVSDPHHRVSKLSRPPGPAEVLLRRWPAFQFDPEASARIQFGYCMLGRVVK